MCRHLFSVVGVYQPDEELQGLASHCPFLRKTLWTSPWHIMKCGKRKTLAYKGDVAVMPADAQRWHPHFSHIISQVPASNTLSSSEAFCLPHFSLHVTGGCKESNTTCFCIWRTKGRALLSPSPWCLQHRIPQPWIFSHLQQEPELRQSLSVTGR